MRGSLRRPQSPEPLSGAKPPRRSSAKVAERFRTIAARRKAVDAYNGANQHTKDLYIDRIQREPQMARTVGQLINDRELVLQRSLGLSR